MTATATIIDTVNRHCYEVPTIFTDGEEKNAEYNIHIEPKGVLILILYIMCGWLFPLIRGHLH